MLTARDFAVSNFGETDFEKEAEKRRLAQLIDQLPKLPVDVRNGLVQDLLQIAGNQNEKFAVRLQATSLLAYQARNFGIQGSTLIARRLLDILLEEFVPEIIGPTDKVENIHSARLISLSEMDLLLLQNLVRAIVASDYSAGEIVLNRIAVLMEGTETGPWLKSFLQKAKTKNQR